MHKRLLIANRGEIAIRIAATAADLGIETVAVFTPDDAASLHVRRADQALELERPGAAGYLDSAALVALARHAGCDAVHPGYGFLAESAAFARQVNDAGMTFIGPRPEVLESFGHKVTARNLAAECGVAVLPGTMGPTSPAEARDFFAGLPAGTAMVIKAIAGGGGRGMRIVRKAEQIDSAFERCASEARAAFGNDELYVEQLVERARHIEVQILGDRSGNVSHLWERECSLQRRHQKLVEMAPSPALLPNTRQALIESALALAAHARYDNLGTMEFLLDDSAAEPQGVFIEANARLQVEHTVSEEITGVDLVAAQLALAAGVSLAELGLDQDHVPPPRGRAVQVRVNMESMQEDGSARPAGGTLRTFEVPTGRGIRVDTFGYAGYTTSAAFDSLLAKVIVHDGGVDDLAGVDDGALLRRAERALAAFHIDGVPTNIGFLRALLRSDGVLNNAVYTRYVEDHIGALIRAMPPAPATATAEAGHAAQPSADVPSVEGLEAPGRHVVTAPMQGTVVTVTAQAGERVAAGSELVIMEAMKMEHVITAPVHGTVSEVLVSAGQTLQDQQPVLLIEEGAAADMDAVAEDEVDLERIRPDLQEAFDRHAYGLDENRPEAVAKRHARGNRTARENIDDLVDPGSFVEYGPLMVAAQRRRRSVDDLMARTTGDGMVAGVGRVNGDRFAADRARVVAMSYDYMVLAGTQGYMNHLKKDRLFELAERNELPVVLFAEGGGGRPGDTDGTGVAGLDVLPSSHFARLVGLVPLVGITNGYCFAGNAALLGCCDVIIATEGSNIGMGGPAMVEGGGLGVFAAQDIGPLPVHLANGVVDVAVADEAEAVQVAKRYLGYFQGSVADWTCTDQRLLRHLIPENRLRVYDIRRVIDALADDDSVLELRSSYGHGMITTLARIEGRPIGIVANNPTYLGGAIDSVGADKAARFMQLCDAFDVPLLFLCDTPGFMVGPEAEKSAQVRRFARMFVVGANVAVPFFTIVLRKGYGLGAQAMAGGSFKVPMFTVSWPTGEFGGMGLEGAVKLGYRNELNAIEDPQERERAYQEMVQRMYDRGKGVSMAQAFEIDDVIDPADSRRWITMALESAPSRPRQGKRRPHIDTW
ncbi:MAG: carboxyl transferase domain-containing protein [Gammaproteobacteria bacterium]|nr:carboxyl transferase domain-containing protein [Gammaproteobacteria bacterium]